MAEVQRHVSLEHFAWSLISEYGNICRFDTEHSRPGTNFSRTSLRSKMRMPYGSDNYYNCRADRKSLLLSGI